MIFPELETERLYLKNISFDDSEFMLKQFSTDAVTKYLYDEDPFQTIDDAKGLIDFYVNTEPRLQHRWILALKENGEKIGTCGFHCWNQDAGTAEIGYDLQEKYWRKGYMKEAVQAILNVAANDMRLNRVDAQISVDNIGSYKLAESLGFQYMGRDAVLNFHGKDYLHHMYELHI